MNDSTPARISCPTCGYTPSARSTTITRYAERLKANPGQWEPWPTRINEMTARSYEDAIGKHYGHKAFRGGGYETQYADGVLSVRYVGAADE